MKLYSIGYAIPTDSVPAPTYYRYCSIYAESLGAAMAKVKAQVGNQKVLLKVKR